MNEQLLLDIADAIEANADHFDLTDFIHYGNTEEDFYEISLRPADIKEFHIRCDTSACVAGWACILMGDLENNDIKEKPYVDWEGKAAIHLDLTPDECRKLFYASYGSVWRELADEYGWDTDILHNDGDWSQITGQQAADVLRRIAKGEVTL